MTTAATTTITTTTGSTVRRFDGTTYDGTTGGSSNAVALSDESLWQRLPEGPQGSRPSRCPLGGRLGGHGVVYRSR